jgi:hypothetical protein
MTTDPRRDSDAAAVDLQADIETVCAGHANAIVLPALIAVLANKILAAPPSLRAGINHAVRASLKDATTAGGLRHDA